LRLEYITFKISCRDVNPT